MDDLERWRKAREMLDAARNPWTRLSLFGDLYESVGRRNSVLGEEQNNQGAYSLGDNQFPKCLTLPEIWEEIALVMT